MGRDKARYRLRIGKVVDSCPQTLGAIDASPQKGLPPNATQNAVMKCATGGNRGSIIKTETVLVTVPAGEVFSYDFEVPLTRDIKL